MRRGGLFIEFGGKVDRSLLQGLSALRANLASISSVAKNVEVKDAVKELEKLSDAADDSAKGIRSALEQSLTAYNSGVRKFIPASREVFASFIHGAEEASKRISEQKPVFQVQTRFDLQDLEKRKKQLMDVSYEAQLTQGKDAPYIRQNKETKKDFDDRKALWDQYKKENVQHSKGIIDSVKNVGNKIDSVKNKLEELKNRFDLTEKEGRKEASIELSELGISPKKIGKKIAEALEREKPFSPATIRKYLKEDDLQKDDIVSDDKKVRKEVKEEAKEEVEDIVSHAKRAREELKEEAEEAIHDIEDSAKESNDIAVTSLLDRIKKELNDRISADTDWDTSSDEKISIEESQINKKASEIVSKIIKMYTKVSYLQNEVIKKAMEHGDEVGDLGDNLYTSFKSYADSLDENKILQELFTESLKETKNSGYIPLTDAAKDALNITDEQTALLQQNVSKIHVYNQAIQEMESRMEAGEKDAEKFRDALILLEELPGFSPDIADDFLKGIKKAEQDFRRIYNTLIAQDLPELAEKFRESFDPASTVLKELQEELKITKRGIHLFSESAKDMFGGMSTEDIEKIIESLNFKDVTKAIEETKRKISELFTEIDDFYQGGRDQSELNIDVKLDNVRQLEKQLRALQEHMPEMEFEDSTSQLKMTRRIVREMEKQTNQQEKYNLQVKETEQDISNLQNKLDQGLLDKSDYNDFVKIRDELGFIIKKINMLHQKLGDTSDIQKLIDAASELRGQFTDEDLLKELRDLSSIDIHTELKNEQEIYGFFNRISVLRKKMGQQGYKDALRLNDQYEEAVELWTKIQSIQKGITEEQKKEKKDSEVSIKIDEKIQVQLESIRNIIDELTQEGGIELADRDSLSQTKKDLDRVHQQLTNLIELAKLVDFSDDYIQHLETVRSAAFSHSQEIKETIQQTKEQQKVEEKSAEIIAKVNNEYEVREKEVRELHSSIDRLVDRQKNLAEMALHDPRAFVEYKEEINELIRSVKKYKDLMDSERMQEQGFESSGDRLNELREIKQAHEEINASKLVQNKTTKKQFKAAERYKETHERLLEMIQKINTERDKQKSGLFSDVSAQDASELQTELTKLQKTMEQLTEDSDTKSLFINDKSFQEDIQKIKIAKTEVNSLRDTFVRTKETLEGDQDKHLMEEMSKKFGRSEYNTRQYARAIRELNATKRKRLNLIQLEIQKMRAEGVSTNKQRKKLARLENEYKKVSRAQIRTSDVSERFREQMDGVGRKQSFFNKKLGAGVKDLGLFGEALSNVGRRMKQFGAFMLAAMAVRGIIVAIREFIQAVSDFDQALHNLQAILDIVSGKAALLGDEIKRVASDTKFSATEVAKGVQTLGQSGLSVEESIAALEGVTTLATGTMSSFKTVSDLTTTTLNAFRLSANESTRVADVFANSINDSKLTVDKLRTSFNYVGAAGKQAGLELNELVGTLMVLADNGMRASTSGTGLRRMLLKMINPTEEIQAKIKNLGLSLDDLNPKSVGVQQAFRNLIPLLWDAEHQTVDMQKAVDMFGTRAAQVAAIVVRSAADGSNAIGVATEKTRELGSAARMASKQQEGLALKIKNLKDKVGVLAVTIGEAGLTAVIKNIVDILRGATEAATNFIGSFKKTTQFVSWIALIVSLKIAIQGVITLMRYKWVKWVLGGFKKFGKTILSKTTAWAAAIGLLVAAIDWVISRHEKLINAAQKTAAEYGKLASDFKSWAKTVKDSFGTIKWDQQIKKFKEHFNELNFEGAKGKIDEIEERLGFSIEAISTKNELKKFEKIVNDIRFDSFKNQLGEIKTGLKGVEDSLDFRSKAETFTKAFLGGFNPISSRLPFDAEKVTDVVFDIFSTSKAEVKQKGKELVSSLHKNITNMALEKDWSLIDIQEVMSGFEEELSSDKYKKLSDKMARTAFSGVTIQIQRLKKEAQEAEDSGAFDALSKILKQFLCKEKSKNYNFS